MKKAVYHIMAFALILTAALVLLAACGGKSQNAKLGLKAMDDGNYDRAKRLYNYAIEKDEADSEDEDIYEILCAYTDAQRALKSGDFAEGLEILDGCDKDYSALSIRADIELLRNQLSDGKYADDRITTLESIIEDGNLERAKEMIVEINKLTLTSAQRSRLENIGHEVSKQLGDGDPSNYYLYYVRGSSSNIAVMYSQADEDSEELARISGGEPVEARSLADNGFIMVVYNGETGYIKASDITPAKTGSGNVLPEPDDDDDKDDKKNDDGEKVPVEAISANDTLYAIMGVNFRSDPTNDSEVMDTIPPGAEVTYMGEMENGFYKVKYDGKVGYAYSDYLARGN